MTNRRIVLTTAGSKAEAQKLARHLVEANLAACVNLVSGVESVYRWKGRLENAREWLLLIKTSAPRVKAVERAIREMHSYDLPECVVLRIDSGSREYLKWLGE